VKHWHRRIINDAREKGWEVVTIREGRHVLLTLKKAEHTLRLRLPHSPNDGGPNARYHFYNLARAERLANTEH
jgi:hypothetical protein